MLKLVDYWAPWCRPCKITTPIIEEIEREYPEIEVEKINVDEDMKKAQEANVSGIPTFIIFNDGVEIARKTGLISKSELLSLLQQN